MNSRQTLAKPPAPDPAAPKLLFPFLDLKAEYATMREDIRAAVDKVLESQQFIMGPQVKQLEAEIAAFIGSSFAVSCASGSDALLLALMALGVDSGDEVITPPFTFVATAGSVARLKAKPVFVDIDRETYNLDPTRLEAAITRRTRAIMPVHLFGLPAEMGKISEIARVHGIPVIEDAAQSIGARFGDEYVGDIGACGCFSFFPSKNLGGAGDGGMITTNDPELAERISVLRDHGSRKKYQYDLLGMNSRLDSLQAAILLIKFKHLEELTKARRRNAERYRQLFQQAGLDEVITLPIEPEGMRHVYNQFVVRTPRRDQLKEHLRASGIPSEIYYPSPLHLQPAFAALGYGPGAFPQSEEASQHVLALPVFPQMTEEQQKMVVKSIAQFFSARS
ncbi:MAG TPA: DegT/DnrJ/EryC1/StrS family aminotransferase [Terriglobales bacterium]|nr:DegT/DnrJ/EryC1/StrS family aminotransferase [Terriglobales bacterium]